MIRALRKRHLWMVAAVAVVTVVLFALALKARPAPPFQDRIPEPLAADAR